MDTETDRQRNTKRQKERDKRKRESKADRYIDRVRLKHQPLNIKVVTYKRVFCNNTKSLANRTINFVHESHLFLRVKLQLRPTRQQQESHLHDHYKKSLRTNKRLSLIDHNQVRTENQ